MCFIDCISTLHSHYELSCRYFSFFTELTYIGLVSYFWASSVQTFFFARSRAVYPLQNWPRPLQFLHLLLHTTIVTYPIIVTAVFWGLIATPDTLSTRWSAWVNISEHALNTVFAAFEIFCTNASPSFGANPQGLSMPWIHLPFLIILLAGYLGVAYITHATQGFYSMSKPHRSIAAWMLINMSHSVQLPRSFKGTRQTGSVHCRNCRCSRHRIPHRTLCLHGTCMARRSLRGAQTSISALR